MGGESCDAPCINCAYLTFHVDNELTGSTLEHIDQSPVDPSQHTQERACPSIGVRRLSQGDSG